MSDSDDRRTRQGVPVQGESEGHGAGPEDPSQPQSAPPTRQGYAQPPVDAGQTHQGHGQPPAQTSPHGQPPHGQPPAQTPPHAQPPAQTPPHAQPPAQTPPHGQPPYAPPAQTPPHGHPSAVAPHLSQPYPHPADYGDTAPSASPPFAHADSEAAGMAPTAQAPATTAPPPTRSYDIETLSGRFIWISLWRAFRLQIHTNEVLASERRTLEEDAQHIVDPEQQAFLAWRRSVLLLVAICFAPLTLVRVYEAFQGPPLPPLARGFVLIPAITEGIFCAIAFDQLKNWTKWKQQRRTLFIAWAAFMFAPFIVYLYPFRGAFEGQADLARQAAEIGGIKIRASAIYMVVGLSFGVQALLALGPKVISLMPGLIRASIVSKLLFPGITAPGWLMILAAPLYALFAYIIVLLPYQITGSWHFVAGNAVLLLAQVFIAWAGRIFTQPLEANDAHRRIHRSWLTYIFLMLIAAGFLVMGLHDFITQLNLGIIRIISGVLSFVGNVLLLTLIGTDAIVSGMAHFRRRIYPDPNRAELLRHSEEKLNRFSS